MLRKKLSFLVLAILATIALASSFSQGDLVARANTAPFLKCTQEPFQLDKWIFTIHVKDGGVLNPKFFESASKFCKDKNNLSVSQHKPPKAVVGSGFRLVWTALYGGSAAGRCVETALDCLVEDPDVHNFRCVR